LLASEKMEERRDCVLAQCRVGSSRDSLASHLAELWRTGMGRK
jgi:hypothetical protein